jgi:peptidoglycan L-alanyl-D-glutamate endopeptidase CwlK
MVDSRAIDQLNPVVQKMCNAFIAKCKDSGITITITSTYRDNEAQAKLYSQGRPLGKKVTDAKPGQSIHNYRLAFDFAPIYDNKAQYNDDLLFLLCGKLGVSCGLEWGGDWKSFKDRPHLQYTNGLTWQDLQAGKTI